jgi:hypothetical protein
MLLLQKFLLQMEHNANMPVPGGASASCTRRPYRRIFQMRRNEDRDMLDDVYDSEPESREEDTEADEQDAFRGPVEVDNVKRARHMNAPVHTL